MTPVLSSDCLANLNQCFQQHFMFFSATSHELRQCFQDVIFSYKAQVKYFKLMFIMKTFPHHEQQYEPISNKDHVTSGSVLNNSTVVWASST
jgi:hypothetical protein